MPLRGPRAKRNETDPLRRRSTLSPAELFRRGDHVQAEPRRHSSDVSAPDSVLTESNDAIQPDPPRNMRRMSAFADSRPLHSSSFSPDPPPSPPVQEHTPNTKRFSLLRFRHASDSQLATRAKEQAIHEDAPPVPALPAAPQIITTAPTMQTVDEVPTQKKKLRFQAFARGKPQGPVGMETGDGRQSFDRRRLLGRKSSNFGSLRMRKSVVNDIGEHDDQGAPATNGDGTRSSLALPFRKSESNRYDRPDVHHHEELPTRPHLSPSKSGLSWLQRRNTHKRQSLFPLPVHLPPPGSGTPMSGISGGSGTPDATHGHFPNTAPATPRASTSGLSATSPDASPITQGSPGRRNLFLPNGLGDQTPPHPSPTHAAALVGSSISFAGPGGPLLRSQSSASAHSTTSSPALAPPRFKMFRNRSATMNSGKSDDGVPGTPPLGTGSGRNSSSTAGRNSLGNLLGLPRFRGSTDQQSSRLGTPGVGSAYNLIPEPTLPDREDGETPLSYLSRLEEIIDRRLIARLLSKSSDDFGHAVMRSHMRRFAFFGDPLDMAIRKLLMSVELPLETQQIDRVLNAFADRYHECNPGIFVSPEQAYFMTFSILMLHTDIFNKNNKRKMTKPDYIKITEQDNEDSVAPDVVSCFYDNIVYTPFIRVEDDDRRSIGSRGKKRKAIKSAIPEPVKTKEPLDPYTLILESKLDSLRPSIKDVLVLDDPYTYLGTGQSTGLRRLVRPSKYGIVQITSERSRPDAWKNQSTIENPEEAKAGVVDLPVHKVGILRRKAPKKRTARKPWEEWGAILTDSELRFTRDTNIIYKYIKQYQKHMDDGHSDSPVVFEPPFEKLPSDAQFPVTKSVTLIDGTYRRHKNAFVVFPDPHNEKGVFEETFLAESEADMNDWITRLNYQAAYKTAGIMPRGLIGGHYEGQRQRGMRRLESSHTTSSLDTTYQTPTGEVTVRRGKIDRKLAEQMGQARRETMAQRIAEAEDKISYAIKKLDTESRNARHLMILAPIQQKTRNEIVQAAARMSQKLKYSRVDVWRMKCHRDILAMDLDEERRKTISPGQFMLPSPSSTTHTATSIPQNASPSSATRSKPSALDILNSKSSSLRSGPSSPKSPKVGPVRPATTESTMSNATEEMDIFHTPPELSDHTRIPPLAPGQISPLSIGTKKVERNGSIASQSTQSIHPEETLAHVASDATESAISPSTSEPIRPHTSGIDTMAGVDSGSIIDDSGSGRPETPTESDVPASHAASSPQSRSKMRRSLQRTLRAGTQDSPLSHHHRGRKGKESVSTTGTGELGEDQEPERLARANGSFNLHGKKASVITFGDEWSSKAAEERLASRRSTQTAGQLAVPSDDQLDKASLSDGRSPSRASQSTTRSANPTLSSKLSQQNMNDDSGKSLPGQSKKERRGTNGSQSLQPLASSPGSVSSGRRESNFSLASEQSGGLERVQSPAIKA